MVDCRLTSEEYIQIYLFALMIVKGYVALQHSLRVMLDCLVPQWLCHIMIFILVGLCQIDVFLNCNVTLQC